MPAVENDWPEQGIRLFHATGVWPVVVRDESVVERAEPDRILVLTVRGWPFGEARVVIDLVAEGAGTRVTMSETPTSGPGRSHLAAVWTCRARPCSGRSSGQLVGATTFASFAQAPRRSAGSPAETRCWTLSAASIFPTLQVVFTSSSTHPRAASSA